MRFTEDIKIDHCWLGLLSWWNHRSHDKEVAYNTIFEEKTRIEAFNGVEKVIGVARVYEPTCGDNGDGIQHHERTHDSTIQIPI